jgi:DNA-binding NarL/FixJ family response regulator
LDRFARGLGLPSSLRGILFDHCLVVGDMQQIRVLVADDNERFGVLLSRFVASHSDMLVVGVAGGGREVVSMAESSQPDVVLMDLYMPDLDGFEATREIAGSHPSMRVIALTAHRSEDNRTRSLDAGAAAFIPKINVDTDLIEVIRNLTRAGRQDRENSSSAGPEEPSAPGS